jgi:hypothetical protein
MVSFTGQNQNESIWVDTLAEALARVTELKPEQFPASLWETPDDQAYGRGRLVRNFPALPKR